jgi:hypothetical protein
MVVCVEWLAAWLAAAGCAWLLLLHLTGCTDSLTWHLHPALSAALPSWHATASPSSTAAFSCRPAQAWHEGLRPAAGMRVQATAKPPYSFLQLPCPCCAKLLLLQQLYSTCVHKQQLLQAQ